MVTPTEKEKLEKVRIAMSVDEDKHAEELEMAGWTKKEFEQG